MEPKKTGEETPITIVPGEAKKPEAGDDTPKTDVPVEVKKVEVDETELAKLKKKAEDFDGLIEKNRLAKLNKSEKKDVAPDEVINKIAELEAEVKSFKADKINDNLKDAYVEFTKEFPWANGDEYFNKISENFDASGLTSKEAIISKLRATTISLFPTEYSTHKEKEIKSKVLAESTKINIGGGSANGSDPSALDVNKQKTEEDKMKDKMAKLYSLASRSR